MTDQIRWAIREWITSDHNSHRKADEDLLDRYPCAHLIPLRDNQAITAWLREQGISGYRYSAGSYTRVFSRPIGYSLHTSEIIFFDNENDSLLFKLWHG